MSDITHTPECIARRKALADYLEKWPNYCKGCGGHGAFIFYETHGDRYGRAETLSEPCDDCTGVGKCPRCGKDGLTSEDRGDTTTGDGPCKSCGWTEKDGGKPEVECWCALSEDDY